MGSAQEDRPNTVSASTLAISSQIPDMLGESPVFDRIRRLVGRLAPTDHSLLVQGPTGSGKEVVARHLHHQGGRGAEPFIDVNCSAISESLIEAQLFGHTKGAYTGAVTDSSGYFGQVGNGTLFLDEIGEMPLVLQPKLLRVLEAKTYRPVGSSKVMHFTGRVIAATHRNLEAMVADGQFREDLYYRLAVFVVELPSLAERRDDIPALVTLFSSRQSRKLEFTSAALNYLCQQRWPGNVRQLRNLVDQLSVLAETSLIDVVDLKVLLQNPASSAENLDNLADALLRIQSGDKLLATQYLLIDRAMTLSGGNRTSAARLLGVSRKIIERRLKLREVGEQAVEGLLNKGRLLADRGYFREAAGILWSCVDYFTECVDGKRSQFEVYRLLEISLRSVNGWLCPDARACAATALDLGSYFCEPHELYSLQFGIWSTHLATVNLSTARTTAQDMIESAKDLGVVSALEEGYVALASTLFWLGDCEGVLSCLSRAKLLGITRSNDYIGAQGFDVACLALTYEGVADFRLGHFAQAKKTLDKLISRSNNEEHPFNQALALRGV